MAPDRAPRGLNQPVPQVNPALRPCGPATVRTAPDQAEALRPGATRMPRIINHPAQETAGRPDPLPGAPRTATPTATPVTTYLSIGGTNGTPLRLVPVTILMLGNGPLPLSTPYSGMLPATPGYPTAEPDHLPTGPDSRHLSRPTFYPQAHYQRVPDYPVTPREASPPSPRSSNPPLCCTPARGESPPSPQRCPRNDREARPSSGICP